MKVSYITDIHLEFIYRNGKYKSIAEIANDFINKLNKEKSDLVFIGGDTTHNVATLIYFLDCIDRKLKIPCYMVLGNHELWNKDNYYQVIEELSLAKKVPYIDIIEQPFKTYGEQIEITLVKTINKRYKNINCLKSGIKIKTSGVTIIGDIGYAGNNKEFNANHGIYRYNLDSNTEYKKSKEWYNYFLTQLYENKKNNETLLVLTHNPLPDWNYLDINIYDEKFKNVYYFNGHTHGHNGYFTSNIYLDDNQSGYDTNEIKFKTKEIKL